MILAEDEIGLGTDHAGIMLLPDGLEPGTPLARRPAARRPGARRDADDEPADLLSMVGVAREVAALCDGELAARDPEDPPVTGAEPVDVAVEDFGGCPRYIGRGFRDVRVGPSPQWLRTRLHLAGMRSISNVVDVTNYVMHVWGSPLHAFDRAKLAGGRIVVRRAREGEDAADARRHRAAASPERDLLITDGERAVALAAIMGGLDSEVSDETTEVLLEAANFEPIGDPPDVRAARAAHRGVEQVGEGRRPVRGRACGRAREPAPRRPHRSGAHRLGRRERRPARAARGDAAARAGERPHRPRRACRTSSGRSSSGSSFDVDDGWQVTVPTCRARDVTREIDLVEEVARVVLDRVPLTMPLRRSVAGHLSPEQRFAARSRTSWSAPGSPRRTRGASCRRIPIAPRSGSPTR